MAEQSEQRHTEEVDDEEELTRTITTLVRGARRAKNWAKTVTTLMQPSRDLIKQWTNTLTAKGKLVEVQLIRQTKTIERELDRDTEEERGGRRLEQHQRRIDQVVARALELEDETKNARTNDSHEDAKSEISESWLNQLGSAAGERADLREEFARILHQETSQPESFGPKSLEIMRTIDTQTAKDFRRAVSLSMGLIFPDETGQEITLDRRVPEIGKALGQNGLQEFGLSYDTLENLKDYGLLRGDYNSWMSYDMCCLHIKREDHSGGPPPAVSFVHQGQRCLILRDPRVQISKDGFRVNGVAFTKAGNELAAIVEQEPWNESFWTRMQNHMQQHVGLPATESDLNGQSPRSGEVLQWIKEATG